MAERVVAEMVAAREEAMVEGARGAAAMGKALKAEVVTVEGSRAKVVMEVVAMVGCMHVNHLQTHTASRA